MALPESTRLPFGSGHRGLNDLNQPATSMTEAHGASGVPGDTAEVGGLNWESAWIDFGGEG